ncbi:MAG: hypothetical protein KF815_12760 [Rhodospirillales bacterium]|nr:hypothetical protein [Rhodospirillales bacterium]
MQWTHATLMSTAEDGTAVVVADDDRWEALPFGIENGSCGAFASREQAIECVESIRGEVVCCVGHLAADADDPLSAASAAPEPSPD